MQLLPVRGGRHFKEMYVGKSLPTYDSMIVLTHFKGHASGGFGGSLKNIAIGCADAKVGKAMQHGGADFSIRGAHFMEHMVEAGKAVTDFFGKRIAYVNVMRRMSVRCDCAGPDAEEPTIGISAWWLPQICWRLTRRAWTWFMTNRAATTKT